MVNKYKYVIFDLDNTLCDYSKVRKQALTEIDILAQDYNIMPDIYSSIYSDLEPILFSQFMNKQITKYNYRLNRFAFPLFALLQDKHSMDDVIAWSKKSNDFYMNFCNTQVEKFDDVDPTITHLGQSGISFCLLTNGPSDGQRKKIGCLDLKIPNNSVFISEEIGFSKPDPRAFEYLLGKKKLRSSECLYVGDSIETDIVGANSANIRAILLDRNNNKAFEGEKISSLMELSNILF